MRAPPQPLCEAGVAVVLATTLSQVWPLEKVGADGADETAWDLLNEVKFTGGGNS